MIQDIWTAFWFFLPAGFANMAPVLAATIPGLSFLLIPIDQGKTYRGKRALGKNKTLLGLLSGIVMGIVIVSVQRWLYQVSPELQSSLVVDYSKVNPLILGSLLGAGALVGDAVASFFKRQKNIPPGTKWIPFDQIDYILGAIVFSLLYVRLPLQMYIYILLIYFFLHIAVSYIGYLVGLKKDPI